jgi:hypothetical protein
MSARVRKALLGVSVGAGAGLLLSLVARYTGGT